jgi:hypothetical protein
MNNTINTNFNTKITPTQNGNNKLEFTQQLLIERGWNDYMIALFLPKNKSNIGS